MGVWSRLFGKRSTPGPLDDFWYSPVGGQHSFAGRRIDPEVSQTVSAVYNAIYIISSTLGFLPLHLYRRSGESRVKAVDNPLYQLIHTQPCPGMASVSWREAQARYLVGVGNCFAEIERDKAYRPVALWIIPPNRVKVERKKPSRKRFDFVNYKVRVDNNGTEIDIPRENMLHIPGLGGDGITGVSPLDMARESVGLSLAYEEYGARFFSGGALSSGIVTYPGVLSDEAFGRFKKSVDEQSRGLSRAHRLMFLEEGASFQQLSIAPDNAQFLESRKFQVSEVARWFNIPPHMLGDLERATFSNIEHLGIEFVQYCLQPWIARIEQALTIQLIGSDAEFYFKFNVDGLLRGDFESRNKGYSQAVLGGWLSRNDVRRLEELDPVDGLDEYLVPSNMMTSDQASQGQVDQEPPPAPPANGQRSLPSHETRDASFAERDKLYERFVPAIKQAADRIVQREAKALKSAVKKNFRNRSKSEFQAWVEEFYSTMPELIRTQMDPVFTAYGLSASDIASGETGSPADTDKVRSFISDYGTTFADRYVGSSRGQIEQILSDSETPEDDLDQRADEWAGTRSDKIAGNESRRLFNGVATTVFFAAGFGARWTIRGSFTCPYCQTLNGSVIREGEPFARKGGRIFPGGDHEPMTLKSTFHHPPLHRGCDCTVTIG
jgi:HK97 family phage portal protein